MTAYTPNLPALITALPGDHTRAPQTEFDRARQVLFLENLSITGSVRSAASAAQVSHQSAYRARRATGAFRTAWEAAMIAARANAEATLAARAIDGVTEDVRYHGEVVGTRTRYSDRLLLAHLGRLDRLGETRAAAAFAGDWDAAMARFAAGEEPLAGEGPIFSSGPCNTRSKSNSDPAPAERAGKAARDDWDDDWNDEEWDDDGVDWDDEEEAEAELARIEAAMDAERPAHAPRFTGAGPDGEDRDPHGLIAGAQHEAFVRGVPRWWLVVAPAPALGSDAWNFAGADAPPADGPPPAVQYEGAGEGAGEGDAEGDADGEPGLGDAATLDDPPEPESDREPGPAPGDCAPVCRPASSAAAPRPLFGPSDDGRCQPFHGRAWTP
jgi:hypothetical protein